MYITSTISLGWNSNGLGSTFSEKGPSAFISNVWQEEFRERIWLQKNGSPTHYSHPNRWIWRGGKIAWPPRSLDINPLNYFLLGYFKEAVDKKTNNSERELRGKFNIMVERVKINRPTLRSLERNFIRRYWLCNSVGGRHFVHLFQIIFYIFFIEIHLRLLWKIFDKILIDIDLRLRNTFRIF